MELQERLNRLEFKTNMIMFFFIVLVVFVLAKEIRGSEKVANPNQALGWALSDLASLQETDRPHQRYIWIPPWGNDSWVACINFAVNTAASQSNIIRLGTPVANGWMLRYDLRQLAPKQVQYDRLKRVWDGLAIQDPYFHIPSINSGIRTPVIAPYLQQQQAVVLAGLSFSTGAIYRADFFLVKLLSTLEGGQYYDFLQVDRQVSEEEKKQGITPQDKFLKTLGVFENTTRSLTGEQRAALVISNVTAKTRWIDVFTGLLRGGNKVFITHDISNDDLDSGKNVFQNLVNAQDTAREIIIERANGTHAFLLTNNLGEFQDSAPDNVVRDTTVPNPHSQGLMPAISCIRCHGQFQGLQPFKNDIHALLRTKLDIFNDLSDQNGKKLSREEAIELIASLYAGNLDTPDGIVGRGRRDYSAVVYKIAQASLFESTQEDIVADISGRTGSIFGSWRYDSITSTRACMELGLQAENGVQGLEELLGEAVPGRIVSPYEGLLRADIPIDRLNFDKIYVDLSLLAAQRQNPEQKLNNNVQTTVQVVPAKKIEAKPAEKVLIPPSAKKK